MQDPYKMVIVNLIDSALVLLGTLFYRFVYPKKKINLFYLLLIIAILPIISVFRAGDYQSGDFNIHVYRIMMFFNSLKEGILFPSWAGEANATYGNPLFLFNYNLPYYGISLLHLFGISFITATKLYLGLVLYFSAISMYFFIKELTNNKFAAFSSSIFYLFAPYHLIDVHFRATLGESTVFLIVPLIFLFLLKYSKTKRFFYLPLISLTTFLLFSAHPLLGGAFFGIGIIFIIFNEFRNKNMRLMLYQLTSISFGAVLSAYIWAPFIIYYIVMYHYPNAGFVGFYPFELLFYSPWRYGLLFQGPKGELATIIGYTQLFVLFISVFLIVTNRISKKIKRQVLFWITLFLTILFLMNPLSNFLWRYIPSIGAMLTQYSRLSLLLAFFTSILAGYFILHFEKRKKLIYLLLIVTIGSTILNWGQRTVLPEINDSVLSKNVPYSTLTEGPIGFMDTKWADPKNPWFTKIPQNHLDVFSGKGLIREIKRTSTKHVYIVTASTTLKIRENTLYFPGWTVTSNRKPVSIHPGYRGIIEFTLPKGIQYVVVEYNDINSVYLLKLIPRLFIVFIILFVVSQNRGKLFKRFSSKP